jgi:hypothetical protein
MAEIIFEREIALGRAVSFNESDKGACHRFYRAELTRRLMRCAGQVFNFLCMRAVRCMEQALQNRKLATEQSSVASSLSGRSKDVANRNAMPGAILLCKFTA